MTKQAYIEWLELHIEGLKRFIVDEEADKYLAGSVAALEGALTKAKTIE